MKNEMRREITYLFWLRYVVFLSSVWKNVGMTMTCNRCDVMNLASDLSSQSTVSSKKASNMAKFGDICFTKVCLLSHIK